MLYGGHKNMLKELRRLARGQQPSSAIELRIMASQAVPLVAAALEARKQVAHPDVAELERLFKLKDPRA